MAEDFPHTVQLMESLETNTLLWFLFSMTARREPQQVKTLTAPWRLPKGIIWMLVEFSKGVKVEGASSTIILPLVGDTGTVAIGSLEGTERLSGGFTTPKKCLGHFRW